MHSLRHLFCAVSVCLMLAAVACGTPGAPQPPSLWLPRPVDDLTGQRKGSRVVLTWTQPTETTDRQAIRKPGITRICRGIDEYPISECRNIVKELGPTELTSTGGKRPRIFFEDVLSPDVMGPQRYATYAIEVLNDRLRSAGLSNQVRVPLAPTLPAPRDLTVQVEADGPVLHWAAVSIAQLSPAARQYEYRYRVYRRTAGQNDYTLVEEVPLNGPEISVLDKSFEWEQRYDYKVAGVTLIPQAGFRAQNEVEGDDSAVVHVTVHDTFPPERPAGLQAVFSGVGQKNFIDLTWAPNTESDLAGYVVYRHEAGMPPVAISKELVKAPAFRDENVETGHTYIYSVRAVDVRGNQSEFSEETSESVPQ